MWFSSPIVDDDGWMRDKRDGARIRITRDYVYYVKDGRTWTVGFERNYSNDGAITFNEPARWDDGVTFTDAELEQARNTLGKALAHQGLSMDFNSPGVPPEYHDRLDEWKKLQKQQHRRRSS